MGSLSQGHSDDFLELRAVDDNCSTSSSSGGSDDDLAGNREGGPVRQPHVVMDLACGILELQVPTFRVHPMLTGMYYVL
jgi:hypothetical protein